ncbi:hypothetical protein Tco_0267014 [Tanacetum coccineum]
MSPSNHGFLNVASSSTSIIPIVERIDKLERQSIERKLILVDDDGKPLPKVVYTINADSDSEVEDVVDDHAVFMASKVLKCGDDSEYGTNSLLEQWRKTKPNDDYISYDNDLYESHDMYENLQAICDDLISRLDVCVDLTGSSPLMQTGMVDFVSRCAFSPLSFSSFGELEKDAVTLLKRIRKFSVAQDIRTRAAIHIFSRTSFAITRGVGAPDSISASH